MPCPTPPESCRPSCVTSSTSPERSFTPVCSSGAPAAPPPRRAGRRVPVWRAVRALARAFGRQAARNGGQSVPVPPACPPAPARPPHLSLASTNPPALAAKAARRRRAAQRRKFWRRGLKLGHFSRPLGHRREQHGALEAPCPAGAFAPGLGGRAAFL